MIWPEKILPLSIVFQDPVHAFIWIPYIKNASINASDIQGYLNQKNTHSEIAAEIAEGNADVGLGLEAAAKAYDLDFIFLHLERYDLVMKEKQFETESIQHLITWLKRRKFANLLSSLGGYEFKDCGQVRWSR
jgi:putative molybdopterin biosynthesis protein